jgi:hypothetical protein
MRITLGHASKPATRFPQLDGVGTNIRYESMYRSADGFGLLSLETGFVKLHRPRFLASESTGETT